MMKKIFTNDETKESCAKDCEEKPIYGYYSKVLKMPFESVDELMKAEAKYYEEQKAKSVAAETRKQEAALVEEAFKALNAAKKKFRAANADAVKKYAEELKTVEQTFCERKEVNKKALYEAETKYKNALREFVNKHPEGYHLTLRDPDAECETTISSEQQDKEAKSLLDGWFNFFDILNF